MKITDTSGQDSLIVKTTNSKIKWWALGLILIVLLAYITVAAAVSPKLYSPAQALFHFK
ncbi:hypothetical protein [Paraglaciecola sp.]|uniref:hypothetical protein n=1 Tax=Paraglaciecola sp. TaxID=1920173 RepID=UPI0030F49373